MFKLLPNGSGLVKIYPISISFVSDFMLLQKLFTDFNPY
ncbi:hypothetical protein [Acinetobacter bereziniae]|nr:hypothetical protein [Acinetobacter bereziniae]